MSREFGRYNPTRTIGPPVRHRSAGRDLIATRYIVGWAIDGIVKVGSTDFGRARYGKFISRGAEIIELAQYPNLSDSLHAECWLQGQLAARYARAFADKEDSLAHLPHGGGWTECFRVPQSDWGLVVEIAGTETRVIV